MSPVDFGVVTSAEGTAKLNEHFRSNTYVTGYGASQDDLAVLKSLKCIPSTSANPSFARWYKHISFFTESEHKMWPKGQGVVGCAVPSQQKQTAPAPAAAAAANQCAKKQVDDDDSDFDPFAEDTAEDKAVKESLAEKAKVKVTAKPKKQVINRSTLVIDVKPNSIDTDLDAVEKLVRKIKFEGLEWSHASQKLPIAYGLMKLQIGCTIVDDLINTDSIVDEIECVGLNEEDSKKKIGIRDGDIEVDEEEEEEEIGMVQSAEIVSFNKL